MGEAGALRLLLDTHAVIWWTNGSRQLGPAAREAIATPDNEVFASVVSSYEISYKFRLGKLPQARILATNFGREIEAEGWAILPVGRDHAQTAGLLEIPHRDPFDRLLIAQAQVEGMTLVSNEAIFDSFGVRRLW